MSKHRIPLGNGRSEHFEIPDNTEVAAVAALREPLERGSAAARAAEKRQTAAHAARRAFDASSKAEVRAAARAGETSPSKKLVKRLRAIEEEVVEADLEFEGAIAVMRDLRRTTVATLVKHAPALRAEAVAQLEADALRLATVHGRLREIVVGLSEHVGTLGLLENLRVGKSPTMRTIGKAGASAGEASAALAAAVQHVDNLVQNAKTAPLPASADERDDETEGDETDDEQPQRAGDMVLEVEPDDEDDDD